MNDAMNRSSLMAQLKRLGRFLLILLLIGIALFIIYRYFNIITSTRPRVVEVSGSPEEIGSALGKHFVNDLIPLYQAYVVNGICKDKGMSEKGAQEAAILLQNKRPFIITTNYYQVLPIPGGVGKERHDIIARTLKNAGSFDIKSAIKALRAARMFSLIPRYPSTLQSVVFNPSDRSVEVAMGKNPATSGRYYRIRY